MRDHSLPPLVCFIDPITLTGLAIGGLAGAAAGGSFSGGGGGGGSAPAPTPTAPPPAAAPQKAPPPKPQTAQTPTFVGGVPAPPQSTGQKTLLGQ